MRYILFFALLLISTPITAGEIMPLPEDYAITQSADTSKASAPTQVNPKKQGYRDIIYMMNNYSVEEMAQYAIHLNKAERQAAASSGKPLPAKLSKEILQNKELIAEYLRSRYNVTK